MASRAPAHLWLGPLLHAIFPMLGSYFLIYRGLNTPNPEEQARTDAKTGLYNARHLGQVLQEEMRRAARFGRPLSIIMIDMDLLRNINNSQPLAGWVDGADPLLAMLSAVPAAVAISITVAYRSIGLYGLIVFFVPSVMLRYVMKQYTDRTEANMAELKRVNGEMVRAHDEVMSTLQELRSTYDATLKALSATLDNRDSDTEGYSQRVVGYVAAIARETGLKEPEISSLLNGALLHDVGRIGVSDAVLNKQGSPSP